MSTSTLSTKGRLVIPRRFRTALHLQPGDQVAFSLEGDRLVISRAAPSKARLVDNRSGRKVLIAPADALPMTTGSVKAIMADFP